MTLNTLHALAFELGARIQWPLALAGAVALSVAGALAVAAVIDLITGFGLTIPDKAVVEVKAIPETAELDSQKKAASIEAYEPGSQELLHARTRFAARATDARIAGPALSAPFGAAARRTGPTAAAVMNSVGSDYPLPLRDAHLMHADD